MHHIVTCKSARIRVIKQSGDDIIFQIQIFPSREWIISQLILCVQDERNVVAGCGVQFGLIQVSDFILINFTLNVVLIQFAPMFGLQQCAT